LGRIVRPQRRAAAPLGRIVHRSGRIAHDSLAALHAKQSVTCKPRQKSHIQAETARILQGLGHAALVPGHTVREIDDELGQGAAGIEKVFPVASEGQGIPSSIGYVYVEVRQGGASPNARAFEAVAILTGTAPSPN